MGNKKRYRFRNVISLSLFFTSPIFIFSGIALYLRPEGSIARWANWTLLGLDKKGWETVHISCAILFIVVFSCHLFFNYKSLFKYLNLKVRSGRTHFREIFSAFILTSFFLVSALVLWEPIDSAMQLRSSFKSGDDIVNIPPPVTNAEDLTLTEMAALLEMPLEEIISKIKKHNYDHLDLKQSLRKIAEHNEISIEKLYIAMTGIQ